MIPLDHNATTPVHPRVLEAMLPWFTELPANPSSPHPPGRQARLAIDEAREHVSNLLGAQPEEIIFTSGGTESSNLAIHGILGAGDRSGLALSTIEHPATSQPAAFREAAGHLVVRLPVTSRGSVDLDAAHELLTEEVGLVSVMHANNETGVIQPIRAVADIAHAKGALLHTDIAQSLGKTSVDVGELGADAATIAGHKLYGPKGIGALYLRRGTRLRPWLQGAGHENGRRPGTENVPGIVGLGEACRMAKADVLERERVARRHTDRLWAHLKAAIPHLRRSGEEPRLPNTLHVRIDGLGSEWLSQCPDVYAGTGSACHAGSPKPSGVLLAMGVDPNDALGSVRLSTGISTTDAQIDAAAHQLIDAYKCLYQDKPRG